MGVCAVSQFIANFHFLRPWWLLGLAAVPLLWATFTLKRGDAGTWRGVVDAHLLRHVVEFNDDGSRSRAPRWLLAIGCLLASLALAGPAWERLPRPLYRNGAARVIALQLSSSMAATDIKPSRYQRARFKIDDILRRSADMQTALIAYAGDAFVVAPLTDDVNTVTNLVDALDPSVMPDDGDNTARAINLGVKLIRQSGQRSGEIILVADSVGGQANSAARSARAQGISVSVLGVGSDRGSPVVLPSGGFLKNSNGDIVLPKLDPASLEAVAGSGGGRYATVSADSSDIDKLLDHARPQMAAHARAVDSMSSRFIDRGPWLVLLLLPIAALGFRRGWLLLLPLAMGLHTRPAAAVSWSDLWQRPDQRARAELDAGHAKRAQAIAQDPSLRGAAAYRAGDYAGAVRDFARRDSADALYNRGNALARQRHYRRAIKMYDQALKQQPRMDDALANRKAVEDWLKKQQKHKRQAQSNSGNSAKQKQQSGQHNQSGGKQPQNSQQQSSSGNQSQRNENASSGSKNDKQTKPQAGNQQAERKAQQQFSKEMEQALKKQGKQKHPPAVQLGAREGSRRQNEQQQAVEQWLQRVPDDPGGLLRRKFQLEYEQRHHQGSVQGDGE